MSKRVSYTYECRDGVCYLVEQPRVIHTINPAQPAQPTQQVQQVQQVQPFQTAQTAQPVVIPMPKKADEWTIYGTDQCTYCHKAKELLTDHNIAYVYHDMTPEIRKGLSILTQNYRYVPAIFNYGEFIGGYTNLCKRIE